MEFPLSWRHLSIRSDLEPVTLRVKTLYKHRRVRVITFTSSASYACKTRLSLFAFVLVQMPSVGSWDVRGQLHSQSLMPDDMYAGDRLRTLIRRLTHFLLCA